jgi:hypothetical protein
VGYLITAGVVRLLKVDRETMKQIQSDLEKRRNNYRELNDYQELKAAEKIRKAECKPGQTRLLNNAPTRIFCATMGNITLSPPCRSTTGWRSAAQTRWKAYACRRGGGLA